MATITVRNLDDSVKRRLRMQTASHDRSMEEEARIILERAVQKEDGAVGLGSRIHRRFLEAGGVEIPDPDRKHKPRMQDID